MFWGNLRLVFFVVSFFGVSEILDDDEMAG